MQCNATVWLEVLGAGMTEAKATNSKESSEEGELTGVLKVFVGMSMLR